MHAIVGTYARAYYPLWYNERKVSEGLAFRLDAGNFLEETRDLTLKDVSGRFARLEELNQRSGSRAMHIMLSFSPADELSSERFVRIARDYVGLMGLGRQPYVVYRHVDAGSPHLHIVVSKVLPGGRLIGFKRPPRRLSRDVVERLTEMYEFVKSPRNRDMEMKARSGDVTRIVYGQAPSTKAIEEVLGYVLPRYAFTSLDELNSILLQYNVYADTGRAGSFMERKRGLVYQIHDEDGKFKGGRIPAFRLPSKPGRAWLEKVFEQNALKRGEELESLRLRLELALRARPADWVGFARVLGREGIHASAFMNGRGLVHELSFVEALQGAPIKELTQWEEGSGRCLRFTLK